MDSKIIKDKTDLTHLTWSLYRNSSGTAGSFLKSYSELGGKKVYYKLSDFDATNGPVGHECVNEIIVDRLLTVLGVPHLSYSLVHADIKIDGKIHDAYLCSSDDFKEKGDEKIALDTYKLQHDFFNESSLDFCIRMGWGEFIYQMLVVDFLILNRDRHGANIEVLKNRNKKTIRPAPLFDHGLSLLCRCNDDRQIENFDVMEDKSCNNFIGSKSTWNNLRLIPSDAKPFVNILREEDSERILSGLDDIISPLHQQKIWEMIWKRWCAYENFCNTR